MQDPSLYYQIKPEVQPGPQFPDQEHLKCPRCDSTNTKFCYYNNYNLSQPRHFCKSCKRYWTKGGALRNIPVGGGSRKNTKRSSSATANGHQSKRPAPSESVSNTSKMNRASPITESSPLKEKNCGGQFGNYMEVSGGQFGTNGSSLQFNDLFGCPDPGSDHNLDHEVGMGMGSGSGGNSNGDGFFSGGNGLWLS